MFTDDGETRRADTRFMRRAMNQPLLSRESEFELARAWRSDGDEAALHELTRNNARIVATSGT